MLEDQALLHAYVSRGSSEAFTRLVERHTNLVYCAALRRVGGDPHRARDVSQRVFVDLARKAPRLVRHPVLVGWLHQSTRWAASSELRAEERRWRAEQAAAQAAMITTGEATRDEWAEVRVVLDEALDALRESDRDAILGRFFQNLSYADIAAQAGCTENAARMRVERALERLQAILHRKGITSTALALGAVLAQNAVAAAPAGLAGGLAAQALATASAAGAIGVTGMWLPSLGTNLPLILVTTIVGVLTWGLLDTRAVLTRDRTEAEVVASRRALLHQAVEELERTKRVEADRLDQLPPLEEMPEPTRVQLERRRLDLVVRKGELDRTHAGLFRRLRLRPETLDLFKELIVDRNQAVYDALQVAKTEGVNLTYAERRELEREAVRPIDREIDALLGSEALQARRFLDTVELRRALAVPGTADDRGDGAVDALLASFAPQLESWLGERERAFGYVPVPDNIETELRRLLTPEEIAGRQRILEADRAGARMIELAREAANAGKLKLSARSERDYPPAKSGSLQP